MPPKTDEIEDAAGRLRRLAAGEGCGTVYAGLEHLGSVTSFYTRDNRTLADAWLAGHPADDGEAIDASLLESLSLTERPEHLDVRSFGGDAGGWNLLCRSRRGGGWRLFAWQHMANDTQDQSVSVIAHTCGQLRRLLAALGIAPAVLLTLTPHGTEGSQWPTK